MTEKYPPGSTAKIYYGPDGVEVTLRQFVNWFPDLAVDLIIKQESELDKNAWVPVSEAPKIFKSFHIVADKDFKHFGFCTYFDGKWTCEKSFNDFGVEKAFYVSLPEPPKPVTGI